MTCIVGLVHRKKVYMGCDSAISSYYGNQERTLHDRQKKIFNVQDMLIGGAGDGRTAKLFQYCDTFQRINIGEDECAYLVKKVIPKLREELCDGGCMISDMESTEKMEASFIVGIQGKIFEIDDTFDVTEVDNNILAIGSGSEYALGSLYSTGGLDPEDRIQLALEAATQYAPGVGGPFHQFKL